MRFAPAIIMLMSAGLACGSDRTAREAPVVPTAPQPAPPPPPPVVRVGHPAGEVVKSIQFTDPLLVAAFVTNEGRASVTQLSTGMVHRIDPSNGSVHTFRPDPRYLDLRGIVQNRAGNWVFVAASYQSWNSLNDVLRLNARGEVVDAYPTSGFSNAPISVLLSRDESTLYVGTGNGLVNAFDVETRKRLFDIEVGSVVVDLAQHPTRDIVYASGFHGVVEIDARTGTFRELEIGGYADGVYTQHIGLSPDGRELYVTYRRGVRPSVLVWDTERRAVMDSISVPAMGHGLVVTPDGAHIYVGSETLYPGEVWVIDRVRRTLIKTIPVGGVVQRLAISPDGFTVVAPNSAGWVDFIR